MPLWLCTRGHVIQILRLRKQKASRQYWHCEEVQHFAFGTRFVDNCIDPPRGQEEWIPVDPRFTNAIDLVKYIRSSAEFSSHFCIGVAGLLLYNPRLSITEPELTAYPDGHPDRGADEESELNFLKEKVDAGADFIATQLFYDVDRFLQWEMKVRSKGRSR